MPEQLPSLPIDIDARHPDRSPGDAEHQQHHDAIHGAFAAINMAGGVATGDDLDALAASIPAPGEAPVESVNGKTGVVVLDAADVGAQPAGSYQPAGDYVTSTTVSTIVTLTQAQYDALGTVDPDTLYVIVG